jgi:hypothetical protein
MNTENCIIDFVDFTDLSENRKKDVIHSINSSEDQRRNVIEDFLYDLEQKFTIINNLEKSYIYAFDEDYDCHKDFVDTYLLRIKTLLSFQEPYMTHRAKKEMSELDQFIIKRMPILNIV